MFLDQVVEVDLYTYLRKQRFTSPDESYATMEDLWLYIPPPVGRSLFLPLKMQQGNGRMSFVCAYCKRLVQKLYVHPGHYNGKDFPIACRKCHQLKYSCQYRKDDFHKLETSKYKLARLESQKRRYWYGDCRTQFGFRHQKLREETKTIWEVFADIEREAPHLLDRFRHRAGE